jgi:uncharacterized protein (DUF2236 family)
MACLAARVELSITASHLLHMQHPVKRLLAERVRDVFNDRARGEQPVQRQADGLFGPGSVVWRVHGDVTSMMVGGVGSLLLQMLHPAVLAGVWDHSNFRSDMHGRLRRTARFIATTTYASRHDAEAAIARVRKIHQQVEGTLPDGRPYSAMDPTLLTWVHVTETLLFLDAWIRYSEPAMSRADQDRYFTEVAVVGRGLGAENVPTTRVQTLDCVNRMRPQLRVDQRTREVSRLILAQPGRTLAEMPLELIQRAAIDLLPAWARRMHRLGTPGLLTPLVRGSTLAMARTLRWAFS